MSIPSYDAIVLGIGGVGSAALWRLARRGVRVLGIDRFSPPHDRGSSHGQTRIIRQAYFEHPDYVPLLRRTYDLWAELEALSGRRLFERTGLLEIGPADGAVVPGVLQAAEQHELAVEQPSAQEIASRWPQFCVPNELTAVYEPTAGFLHVERCLEACLAAAHSHGAETLLDAAVLGWRDEGQGLTIATTAGEFPTKRLVIAAGAWAGGLLKELGVELTIRRKSLFWFTAPADHAPGRLPPFLFELPAGVFYGFPAIEPWGLKIGDHAGGKVVKSPEEVDRTVDDREETAAIDFLRAHLPGVEPVAKEHATCLYTMSPDENFIVGRSPSDDRICFAAGLSGHGFKFAPVLGEALADLALEGETRLPVGFLSAGRFSGDA